MAVDLIGWDNTTAFVPRGDKHRKHRRFFYQKIGTKSSLQAFYPAEQEETKQFLRNTLKNPDDLLAECRRCGTDCPLDDCVDAVRCGSEWPVR